MRGLGISVRCRIGWLLAVWLLGSALPLAAADLAGWRLMQLAAPEQLAVFRSAEGELRLVQVGDRLGEHLVVTGFDSERVILERPGEWGQVTLFVSLVDGRQRVASRERQPLRKAEIIGSQGPP